MGEDCHDSNNQSCGKILPERKSESSDSFNAGVLAAAKLLHNKWEDKLAKEVLELMHP